MKCHQVGTIACIEWNETMRKNGRSHPLNFRYSRFAANWNRTMNRSSIAISANGEKTVVPVYAAWMRSFP